MNGKAIGMGAAGSVGTGLLFGLQYGVPLLGAGGALAFLTALAFLVGLTARGQED